MYAELSLSSAFNEWLPWIGRLSFVFLSQLIAYGLADACLSYQLRKYFSWIQGEKFIRSCVASVLVVFLIYIFGYIFSVEIQYKSFSCFTYEILEIFTIETSRLAPWIWNTDIVFVVLISPPPPICSHFLLEVA